VGWLVEGLGSLRELRVLNILYISWEEDDEMDMVESLRHLHKLHSLTIKAPYVFITTPPTWQATEDFVLPHHLRHLAVDCICFSKLPSCIDPSCMPNLTHLELVLHHLDEEDLKTMGGLPELHYLSLDLEWSTWSTPATIHNIRDSSGGSFPLFKPLYSGLSCFWYLAEAVAYTCNDVAPNYVNEPFFAVAYQCSS
jgi:disease resistance protein RPM1